MSARVILSQNPVYIEKTQNQNDLFGCLGTVSSSPKQEILSRDEIYQILNDVVLEAPLVDYLVAHGAISMDDASHLQSTDITKLLSYLEVDDKNIKGTNRFLNNHKLLLLINALRNTGQHRLASKLDCGRKINPAPLQIISNGPEVNSDGDGLNELHTPIRRRGQLRLWLQVNAIRVCPTYYEHLIPTTSNKLADTGPLKHLLQTAHGAYFWIDFESTRPLHNPSEVPSLYSSRPSQAIISISAPSKKSANNTKSSRCSRIFSCFCIGKHRKETVETRLLDNKLCASPKLHDYRLPSSVLTADAISCATITSLPESEVNFVEAEEYARQERIRAAKLTVLDKKSNEFYQAIIETSSLNDALVKHLEQTAGVLVLSCKLEAGLEDGSYLPATALQSAPTLTVSIVATTQEAVKRLFSSVAIEPSSVAVGGPPPASQLSTALEDVLNSAGILDSIGVEDLRLSVGLETEEVRLVISELIE